MDGPPIRAEITRRRLVVRRVVQDVAAVFERFNAADAAVLTKMDMQGRWSSIVLEL